MNALLLDWDNSSWCAYFFAEVSALAYHDGTKAKKELKAIGFNSYKFLENDGAQCHIFNNSEHLVIAFRAQNLQSSQMSKQTYLQSRESQRQR